MEEDIKKSVQTLSALAQESRVKIFKILVEYGSQGLPAGDLARRLKTPQNTISFHLKEMHQAQILEARREGRKIYYSFRMESIDELIGFLLSNCCKAVDVDSLGCSSWLERKKGEISCQI